MKLKLVILAFCLFFVGSTAFAASTYYIPQVAIGHFNGGSYRTTFVFFNNQSTFTNITLALTDQTGDAMSVNLPGMIAYDGIYSFQLGPGSTKIIQTDDSGNARVGAATITSDLDIGVSGIYTINDTQGKFVTEVGVRGASLMNNFVIPIQTTADGTITTGLALYNPNSSNSTLTLSLKNEDGTSAAPNAPITLAAGQQWVGYIDNPFPSINHTKFSGMLTVQSSAEIAAVTLRQNAPSFLTYTSIPVVPTTSTQTTFNLAHVVDGIAGGTPYKTTFMLFNFGTASATVTLTPTKDDGTPFTLTMTDASTTAGTYTIPAGGSAFLQTNGTANAQGAVKIASTAKIGAAALFTEYNNDQSFNTEAGVQDSPAFTNFTLPIDSRVSLDGSATTSDTGIAFFNPGTSSVSFNPKFLDADGIVSTSTTTVSLPAKGHEAYFFNQLFPLLGNIQGSIAVAGLSNGVSAMTLRLNMVPFSMTTLPVVSGVAPGLSYPTTGAPVRKTLAGAIATDNTTVDAKLPIGYPLTFTPTMTGGGSIWAMYGGQGVTVTHNGVTRPATQTCSTALYQGACYGTISYSANLAPGPYTFGMEGYVGGQTSAYFWFYRSTDLVTVSSNATVPVTAAFPAVYTVTGSISGLTATNGKIVLYNTDNSGSYGYNAVANGAYTIQVPSGTYDIDLVPNWPYAPAPPYYDKLGTVVVDGTNTAGPNIVLPPLVNLTGTAHFTDTAPAITITATDSLGIGLYTYISTTASTASNGSYTMNVVPNTPYNLSLAYSVYASTSTTVSSGTVNYAPTSPLNPFTLTGNSTYDFTMPILGAPSLVTISGTVTDSAGAAVSGATVTATSNSLTGASSAVSYTSASATTSTTGAYSLNVVPGVDYSLTFVK
jgi:hypothetical protein